jgi:hypothetical protein
VATAAKARITSAAVVSRSVIGSIAVNMVNIPPFERGFTARLKFPKGKNYDID